MKLTRHHIAQGWKISEAESKKEPYTPWAPNPYRVYLAARPTVEDKEGSTFPRWASRTRNSPGTTPKLVVHMQCIQRRINEIIELEQNTHARVIV